jgi:hypothetical protein
MQTGGGDKVAAEDPLHYRQGLWLFLPARLHNASFPVLKGVWKISVQVNLPGQMNKSHR